MYRRPYKKKLEMAKGEEMLLHVADVYDLAAEIGSEFEKVIDVHGTDVLRELMTKVIVSLEYLETSTVVIDSLQEELLEIKARVKQLEFERLERAEFRSKLDHELEQIEENWRKEISQLNMLVAKLQEENKRLSILVADRENSPDQVKTFFSDEDLEQLQRLREVTEQQRGQLLNKDKEYLEKCSDVEKVEMEKDQLMSNNRELARKNGYMQKQVRTLVEEKSDLQAYLQDHHREFQALQKKFQTAVKENNDLITAEEKHAQDLAGKLVIDRDDPNRPCFTVNELRHILFERNDLKAKVSDLEDELKLHRPPKTQPSPPCVSPPPPRPPPMDDDLPVQGPINKEPDEKLYPGKRPLGIRRFFGLFRRLSMDSGEYS